MIDLDGALLAGGQSRRMGRDKASLLLGGESMIDRIASAMAPLVSRLRVVGSRPRETSRYPVQADLRPGLGPLSGIHAALATAEAPAVLVVACDLPFVSSEFLAALSDQLSSKVDAVIPKTSSGSVPVCAVYRTKCLDALETALDDGALKAQEFVGTLNATYVDVQDIDANGTCLRNINTPEDFEQAQALLSRARDVK